MATDQRIPLDFSALANSSLNTNTVFEILSDSRRRFILSCLQRYATPMALADVVDELATWEYETRITDIPAEEVTSTYIALYHVHVPKLDDAGLVEYNQDRDTVILTEDGDEIASELPSPWAEQ